MNPAVVFLIVVVVMLTAWWIARSLDAGRIELYLKGRGCALLSQQWRPFGRGWFGSTHERIYEIRYRDRDGSVHEALAKTSMLAGVYLSEDQVVQSAPAATQAKAQPDTAAVLADNQRLLAENQRLRAEIEQLRRRS
jgi:hypothetical protein